MNYLERPVYIPDDTFRFLQAAITNGAIGRVYDKYRQKNPLELARVTRLMNTAGSFLASPATLDQIGQVYGGKKGLTRQSIQQKVQKAVLLIYNACTPELKEEFDNLNLSIRKNNLVTTGVARLAQDDQVRAVLESDLKESRLDYQELISNVPAQKRRALRELGVPLPRMKPGYNSKALRIAKTSDPDEVRILMSLIGRNEYAAINRSTIENKPLISLTQVIMKAGLSTKYTKTREVIKILRESGIPIAEFPNQVNTGPKAKYKNIYHVIHRLFLDQAIEALKIKR